MTSTASQQQTSAPNSSSPAAAASYASAAGAAKKSSPNPPVIVAGTTNPPLVVGSSAQTASNGKSSSASPVNGRPAVPPAVPASTPPAVVHGSNLNGSSDHSRKSSVTISATAPSSNIANGGAAGSRASIQFGFKDSPAIAHSTPQQTPAAPIPIPGAGNSARVPSPAHSPLPIPQPSASGGRPPSGAPPPAQQMTFGSFPGDGDRQVRQPQIQQNNSAAGAHQQSGHMRRDSQASAHGDVGGHSGPSGPNRGGYQGQGGRGGRNFNNSYNNSPSMPYNPNQRFSGGPNGGRGGMPTYQTGRAGMPPSFPSSPQPPRASPAQTHALPHQVTPNMASAVPMQNQAYYPQPMYHQMSQPYSPAGMGIDYNRAPVMGYGYPMAPYMPGHPGPQQYTGVPYAQGPPAAQPMSRNSSQVSERPSSSMGHSQAPPVALGTPQQRPAQPAAPAATPTISRGPRKNAALVIKDPSGNVVNLNGLVAPASPAPSVQQSKTPPIVSSTPTPPPKPSTPATHARSSSASAIKTAEQVRNEFREQIRKAAEEPTDAAKSKESDTATADDAESLPAEKAEDDEQKKEKANDETSAVEEAKPEKAAIEPKAEEPKPDSGAEEKKEEGEAGAKEPASSGLTEEEELERIIREMEEEDARREKEQAELTAKKDAEKEEAKKRAEKERIASAAENDRKLREQEREMERIEEERERQRKEKEQKASEKSADSVSELLAKKIEDLKLSEKKDSAPSADKAPATKPSGGDKARAKPAALNLAVNTKPVEPPQPSAALQSLRSARFLDSINPDIYPAGFASPNPALNSAVSRKGKTFKYDAQFLLQFQNVFTEQPSTDFHQQVKTLIGEPDGSRSASARGSGPSSSRQGSKAGSSAAFPQGGSGSFGQFVSKTLPPGTTSEQRFAMSQGNMARPAMSNPMASFGRPGAFPGSHPMSRTPSSTAMGGMPNSPRQGSRRGGGSKRGDFGAAKDSQIAKTMPLTQGIEIKPITVSAGGWKPTSITGKAAQGPGATAQADHLDPDMVQRKVKAALNKMTPEKFEKISDQILTIAGQSKNEQDGRTLRQVIQLTFEKATDESHWAGMYAKFCKRMLETMSPEIRDENILDKQGNVVSGGALFRKYLLNRCQEEFERGWKIDLPELTDGEGKKPGEAALLSDEYYIAAAAKRRGLGLVQFIGELYKLGMLTERIMHECVRKLLEFQGIPDEAEIESLTKLLRTIGGNLDSTEKGRPVMDVYFQRIQTILNLPELPSRLKFMLMDIVDLRRAGWTSKEANKGPKTLEEVRAEAEAQAAQKAAENSRSNQRGPGGGRPPIGRGDARSFSGYNQPVPNQVGIDDLRRLKVSANRSTSQNVSFGPTSMFNSRSNSGRRLGPGGSFGRGGEDSGASSRTGTPPTREKESVAHTNAFG